MRREQKPAMWLGVNLALALGYASAVAFPLNMAMRSKPTTS
jgi:hypothetical protein